MSDNSQALLPLPIVFVSCHGPIVSGCCWSGLDGLRLFEEAAGDLDNCVGAKGFLGDGFCEFI